MQSHGKILETSAMALGTPHAMTENQAGFVKPQLWSVEDIRPEKIPASEKRRVVMRLTMSSVFAGSDKWLPLFALNGGCRVSLTLDLPEDVAKMHGATGQATQSASFELSAAVCLRDSVVLDSALQKQVF